MINLFFGAMGVWAPLISDNGNLRQNFIGVLNAGGLYTFLCAYLAAASGYIVFEYLNLQDANYKNMKAFLIGVASILIVISGIIVGQKINNSTAPVSNNTIDSVQIFITAIALLVGFLLGIVQFYSENGMDSAVDSNQKSAKNSAEAIFENLN